MSNELLQLLTHQQLSTDVKCFVHNNCSNEESLVLLGRNVVLGLNTCYIAGAVLLNEKKEILLIQEAKASCRGTWYLPCGRVEPDETLIDAVKREVEEEAGLIFKPTGLISIELQNSRWMRFIFAGIVTGGSLKTTAEADDESLQAAWVSDPKSLELRAWDMLRVIDLAKKYYEEQNVEPGCRKFSILPTPKALKTLFIRPVVVCKNNSDSFCVLHLKNSHDLPRLPISCLTSHSSPVIACRNMLQLCLTSEGNESSDLELIGVLGVQHSGESKAGFDGICLTILFNLKLLNSQSQSVSLPHLESNRFSWNEISEGDIYVFLHGLENQRKQCVPLVLL